MGFREPLPLGDILEQFDNFRKGPRRKREVITQGPYADQVPNSAYTHGERAGTGETPALVGAGPHRASTCRSVAPAALPFAWDPNWYYRSLGIPWPYVHATRKDLRLAYHQARGERSRWLTYCMKQLLDREVRAEYDALPLGEQYLACEYVQEFLAKQAADEASQRSQRGDYITAKDVLDQWGYTVVPHADPDSTPGQDFSPDVVDTDPFKGFDEDQHRETVGADWHYSFYLWKTTRWDTERLATWQSLLIAELDQRNISATLTVGLMGDKEHPYTVAEVAGEWVLFLSRHVDATPDLAARAATALHSRITTNEMRPARRALHTRSNR